jgi:Fungal protein kinase
MLHVGLYLLWQIGIAHGDVSLSNMMVNTSANPPNAILNDFDLAAPMNPGSPSPSQPGFEKVGTRPFIGMDMFFAARKLNRGFRHDLESALWSAVWYCQEQPEWVNPSLDLNDIREMKIEWIQEAIQNQNPDGLRRGSEQLWGQIGEALWEWTETYVKMREPKTDQEWLEIVHRHLPCPEHIGIEWMRYRVPPNIKARDRTPAS